MQRPLRPLKHLLIIITCSLVFTLRSHLYSYNSSAFAKGPTQPPQRQDRSDRTTKPKPAKAPHEFSADVGGNVDSQPSTKLKEVSDDSDIPASALVRSDVGLGHVVRNSPQGEGPNLPLSVHNLSTSADDMVQTVQGADLSALASHTEWTARMFQTQLELLLQCQGQPASLATWHQKLVRSNAPPPNHAKVLARGLKLARAEKCSQVSGPIAWTRETLLQDLPAFTELYNERPMPMKFRGSYGLSSTRLTHSFSHWVHARRLQPRWVIVCGVRSGYTTWLLRQGAPTATIVCLEPSVDRIRIWDPEAVYYAGAGGAGGNSRHPKGISVKPYKDFGAMDWGFIPDKQSALILFDDQHDQFERVEQMLQHGFKHALFDDNWYPLQGDTYSLKQVCDETGGLPLSPLHNPPGDVVLRRRGDGTNKFIPLSEHLENRRRLINATKLYYEMPPILFFPPLLLHTPFRIDKPSNLQLVHMTAALIAPPLIRTQAEFDRQSFKMMALREFWMYASAAYLGLW
uniref:Uncharacterized protein n=1 Tax=Eutreptiella gymnastica TaxID=73025 RepID=A0A7S1N6I6_9EUGL|mmetsp:Transcript_124915/g.216537  ORF Transcript_124915/g.216537 Transcript_124915/m.216537 type:complete len:515 (+) Transcript_124915:79-1623(+)